MSEKTVSENIKSFAVKKAIDYVSGDPEKNIPKLINWADKFDKDNLFPAQRKKLHEIIDNPDNNWYRLILSLWSDIDDDVRKTMFENLAVNSFLIGMDKQHKIQDKYNCNVPWAILMDPTSACNLHCTGCWAAEYGNKLNMSYETLDDIINQGKEMGTYMYLFSGGEPLVRKKDIIRLCEAHPDCQFLAFTNGTLIDEEFADEMLRVKNFIPAISVEGFEEATDFRRGKGTFKAVMKAMEILKRKKLPFGASCCYTSQNVDSIGSEEFIDMLVDNGVKFAWFFHYMPVGNDAVTDLLPTPEQREKMYSQIRSFRETKPVFTIDFQNDGEFVGGCVAGGRLYLHINANGDIEPCAFIHYSDSNIKDKTLLEAYTSPLFMAYKNNQPFNENMFRPCPMLENPEYLEKMVAQSNAHSTDMQSPESAEHLCGKCKSYAENWIDTADKLWSMSPKCKNCSQKCSK
ncbi:radical SAM protein [uncultured Ruminococcus sp.]|uniref:radical SAM protein n=1 Tax=uncultured Ruminococcus sp. TaxID=165186 RepID=UPI0025D8B721|nr:radical SAM protein [uncultured Ruminococcus sp.]